MALSEIYVDPSIAADSGAGTIGDPFGDLEYAIEQTTFNASGGTRVNIKAGTDEVLAATLETALADTSVTAAWVTSSGKHCIFEGYTTAAGDGGIGGISGGGSIGIMGADTPDYIIFRNLHLHNCGAAEILTLDNNCAVFYCELNNTSGNAIDLDNDGLVIGCYIHDIGGVGIHMGKGEISHNFLANGTKDFTTAITMGGAVACHNNIISIDGTSNGISPLTSGGMVFHNSIYSAGGTGQGIVPAANIVTQTIRNNLVEGFSGAGGVGIKLDTNTFVQVMSYDGNAVYNCENEYTASSIHIDDGESDNETLAASPFTNAAGGDFSPVDTGNVKEGALPTAFYV